MTRQKILSKRNKIVGASHTLFKDSLSNYVDITQFSFRVPLSDLSLTDLALPKGDDLTHKNGQPLHIFCRDPIRRLRKPQQIEAGSHRLLTDQRSP